MGPPSYMQSVVEWNAVMRRMTVQVMQHYKYHLHLVLTLAQYSLMIFSNFGSGELKQRERERCAQCMVAHLLRLRRHSRRYWVWIVAVPQYTDTGWPVSGFPQAFQANTRTNTVWHRSFLPIHFQFSIHDCSHLILNNLNIEIFTNNPHTNQ